MYPIVLAHGFLGYRKIMLWSMFEGVEETLRERGYVVKMTFVHPTASIEERAGLQMEFIQRELGPDEPFHWIGHSMGGLDGRYIASPGGLNLGHRFLTLTTLSTPHHGSPLAERIPRWARLLISRAARTGRYLFSGEQRIFLNRLAEERWDGLYQLSPDYLESEFNPRIPDHPQVRYFSYAGWVDFSAPTLGNLLRRPAWKLIRNLEGDNDGMVSVQSAQWGEYKGILSCDHGEIVGLRVLPWKKSRFDHIALFLQLAHDLGTIESTLTSKID